MRVLLLVLYAVGLCAAVRTGAKTGGFDPEFSPEAMYGKPIPRPVPPPAIPQPRVIHPLPPVFNEPGKCKETCHGHGQCLIQLDKVTLSPSGNVQIHPYKCFCDVGWVGETCATPVDAYLKYFLTHGKSGHPPCCRVCRSQREPLDRYSRIPFATDLIDPLNPFFSSRESDTVKGSQSRWMEPLGANRYPRWTEGEVRDRMVSASNSFLAVAEMIQKSRREGGSYSHTEVHDDVELGDAPASSAALYDSLMSLDTSAHATSLLEGQSHARALGEGEADADADAESGADAEKFSLKKLGAWAKKAVGVGKNVIGALKGLLGGNGGRPGAPPTPPTPVPPPPPPPNPAAGKLAGPGGIIGANGLPVPPPRNVWSFYPPPVDPMSHPVKPCCVFCDFQEDFPRKSEQKGKYAQRIERLLKGMTRREYERTQFQNEQGCCLVCPRYDPKQTADDTDNFNQRGHFPVRRPQRRKMHRSCCETCPSQFWLKDTSIDGGAFKPPPLAPKKGAPPIADAIKKAVDSSQAKGKKF